MTGSATQISDITQPTSAFVAELKQRDGRDIGVHGSLSLARTLLAEHLIDELRLVVAPSLAGHGQRLFDGDAGQPLGRSRLNH